MLHIFTANFQPATGWIDNCGEVELRGGFAPTDKIYTDCCSKKRLASKCIVQCFYDGLRVWCAPECGCKNPNVIAKKRRAEHMNRSRAQQARRQREGHYLGESDGQATRRI